MIANYIFISNFFSEQECNRIKKEGQKNLNNGIVGESTDLSIRNSNVSFINNNQNSVQDLMQKAVDAIVAYAKEYYLLVITKAEPIQYAEYTKDMFYTWHTDSTEQLKSNIKRDISASIILSKKEDYKGGSLQMITENTIKNNVVIPQDVEDQEQGTLIIFPSNMIHRVSKVTSGLRASLVLWTYQ